MRGLSFYLVFGLVLSCLTSASLAAQPKNENPVSSYQATARLCLLISDTAVELAKLRANLYTFTIEGGESILQEVRSNSKNIQQNLAAAEEQSPTEQDRQTIRAISRQIEKMDRGYSSLKDFREGQYEYKEGACGNMRALGANLERFSDFAASAGLLDLLHRVDACSLDWGTLHGSLAAYAAWPEQENARRCQAQLDKLKENLWQLKAFTQRPEVEQLYNATLQSFEDVSTAYKSMKNSLERVPAFLDEFKKEQMKSEWLVRDLQQLLDAQLRYYSMEIKRQEEARPFMEGSGL